MAGLFKKGYEANREEVKRNEIAKENLGKKLFDFYLQKDGEEADVRFLTEEPINFQRHIIPNGKKYDMITCTGENCSLCNSGDEPKSAKAFLVIDRREVNFTDKNGNEKTLRNQAKLLSQGIKFTSKLDRISEKYGLTNRDVTIVRLGTGTSTDYMIERCDESKISEKEIKDSFPEKLQDEYNGTMDSLYKMVEEQLMIRSKDYVPDEEDYVEEPTSSADGIISVDDEEEEEKPKKKLSFKKKLMVENSVRPKAKDMLK